MKIEEEKFVEFMVKMLMDQKWGKKRVVIRCYEAAINHCGFKKPDAPRWKITAKVRKIMKAIPEELFPPYWGDPI
jgi:hypothetical protein